jgi:hypothetical protein
MIRRIPLVKFILLNKRAASSQRESFFKYYSANKFGRKYQILADILYARELYFDGKELESLQIFTECYNNLNNYKYLDDTNKIFLRNFIRYYINRLKNIIPYHVDRDHSIKNSDIKGYIKYAFHHDANYGT